MKEVSSITALLKMILYDILGILIPGMFFLALGLVAAGDWLHPESPLCFLAALLDSKPLLQYLALIVAYVSGYLLQSIAQRHIKWFETLGRTLLNKEVINPESPVSGTAPSSSFVEQFFSQQHIFAEARRILGQEAGIENAEKLRFSDVSDLSLTFAGEAADVTGQFRYRADLCGAMAVLSMLITMLLPVLLVCRNDLHWAWLVTPLWFGRCLYYFSHSPDRAWKKRTRLVVPILTIVLFTILTLITGRGVTLSLALSSLMLAWFFFLWRCYFYQYLGGTVHFAIALVALAQAKRAVPHPGETPGK